MPLKFLSYSVTLKHSTGEKASFPVYLLVCGYILCLILHLNDSGISPPMHFRRHRLSTVSFGCICICRTFTSIASTRCAQRCARCAGRYHAQLLRHTTSLTGAIRIRFVVGHNWRPLYPVIRIQKPRLLLSPSYVLTPPVSRSFIQQQSSHL